MLSTYERKVKTMAYKTNYSETYYREMWHVMEKRYTKNDPYKALKSEMKAYKELPEEVQKAITQIEATNVYKKISEDLKETMRMLDRILSGQSSLGYTTLIQEVQAKHELREGFEFDCLRLADFRKEYGIQ